MDVFHKLQLKTVVSIVIVHGLIIAALLGFLNFFIFTANSKEAVASLDHLLATNIDDLISMSHDMPPFEKEDGLPGPRPDIRDDMQKRKPPFPMDDGRIRKFDLRSILIPVNPGIFDMRNCFVVQMSGRGEILQIINEQSLRMTETNARRIAGSVFVACQSGVFSGLYQGMFWKAKPYENGYLVGFLDRTGEIGMERRLLYGSVWIYGISLLLAAFFGWILSLWTVRPVKEDFERQKQFIADAGHELKTPIAVIGANIDVLMGSYPGNKWLEYVKAENQRMGELVKNLLYLAKNDANRQTMDITQFDLCEAVNSVVLPFESTFYEQGKKFELNVPDTPLMMYGDEQKIKQVVIILVDNALKNSEKGALVRVAVVASGNRRIVRVYNTGHGIAPDDLEKIFERFYRADTSRARQTGGYGLGLAIARSVADAHGGTLTASSELEKWAEFTFDLPAGSQGHHPQKKH